MKGSLMRRFNNERGLTLIEMMIAMFVFGAVLAGALAFLRAQGRSFSLGSQRVMMIQNARFGLNELEKDLRTAGAGAPDIQPQLIYLGPSVVAFNANYLTNTPGDVFAVYYNPDAPDASIQALTQTQRLTIPTTSFSYPDTTYTVSGINSPAEMIAFWFSPDSTTPRTDDYILFRQVNNLTPEVVSRNILATAGVPFFQYYWQWTDPFGGGSTITAVPSASLPLMHSVKIHLSIADTGVVAKIDSVRAVRVSFTITNGLTGASERQRAYTRYIRLPNVGLAVKKTCGDAPILGTGVTVAWDAVAGGVDVQWNEATDEAGGEKDIERYVIWRKQSSDPAFGDAYLSIPAAGTATYTYTDRDVTSGTTYVYALAAEDCTPSLSTQAVSGAVTIP